MYKDKITLTTKETAEYLGVSVSSLVRRRLDGLRASYMPSPPFIKAGRTIRYPIWMPG